MTDEEIKQLVAKAIQGLADVIAADKQEQKERYARMDNLIESNSRSIQGLTDMVVTDKLEQAERNAKLDKTLEKLTALNEGVVNLLSSMDEDRPTVLRKLNAIENKVDRLLERPENNNS